MHPCAVWQLTKFQFDPIKLVMQSGVCLRALMSRCTAAHKAYTDLGTLALLDRTQPQWLQDEQSRQQLLSLV